jgi:hypothetical protein
MSPASLGGRLGPLVAAIPLSVALSPSQQAKSLFFPFAFCAAASPGFFVQSFFVGFAVSLLSREPARLALFLR